jgi:hypothetical protein
MRSSLPTPDSGIGPNVMSAVPGTLTRPLCPYPKVARWTGEGSTKLALNFRRVKPKGSDDDDR